MKKIKNYFNLSKREYTGTVAVTIAIALLTIIRFSLPYITIEDEIDFSKFNKEIDEFEKSVIKTPNIDYDNDYVTNYSKYTKYKTKQYRLFNFDPNSADSTTFLMLGLSSKQIRIICNFRRKGGKFYNKESFAKMYGLNAEKFSELEPFILIDLKKSNEPKAMVITKDTVVQKSKAFNKIEEDFVVEINDADTTTLKKLKGIGSSFAKRIITYRDKLGGFISKEQLFEVYGFDSLLYNKIEKNVIIDTNNLKKININKASFYSIKYFPYLKQSQSMALINYRDNHGKFVKITDLKKCILIDDKTYNKIRPYIKIAD